MTIEQSILRPGEFCRLLLRALDASEGRRRRRKRDTTPDAIGLGIKRDLLEAAMADDPAPDELEGWMLTKVLTAPASGPVLALCMQIMDEYRAAASDASFSRWLADGAPSADAEASCDVDALGARQGERTEPVPARLGACQGERAEPVPARLGGRGTPERH